MIQSRTLAVAVAATLSLSAGSAGAAELLAGVAANGRLVVFSSDDPSEASVVQVSGLAQGESILGIDRRPATGQVYVLGSTSRLYTIDVDTGAATAVGSAPFTPSLSGTRFGFDFNPTVDRIRIVSDSGQNLRAHPDTGVVAFVDAPLAYAAGDPGFGSMPAVAGAAYTNSDADPATGTALYDIDEQAGALVTQNPPNDGKLNTVGSLGIDFESIGGFDIAVSDGTAYAGFVHEPRGNGNSRRSVLYTIDLATGEATKVGKIGGPKILGSLTALGQID
jgi:hypothetical protein